jgi:hypothetical protein
MMLNLVIQKFLMLAVLLGLAAAAACSPFPADLATQPPATEAGLPTVPPATETAAPAPTDTQAPPATPTPEPTTQAGGEEPEGQPTAPPVPGGLPAPLYFIGTDGQLWQVPAGAGGAAVPVTQEAQPVTGYAVSPADGSLAYISGNSLILAQADGSGREVVFGGGPINQEDRLHTEIMAPHYSPDGRQISFGYGGIQILDLGSTPRAPFVLIPSDPMPDMNAGRPEVMPQFYRQAIWSPDGTRLLVELLHFPEGGGWAVLLLNSDAPLVVLNNPGEGGLLCCDPAWSQDSQSVYFASSSIGLQTPGLYRSDANTGETVALLAADFTPGSERIPMVNSAAQLADGQLYFFYTEVTTFPDGSFEQLTMHRAAPDGTGLVPLRAEPVRLAEVEWAPGASGAVVMLADEFMQWPFSGPLAWLPADGSPAVSLGVEGSTFTWGK